MCYLLIVLLACCFEDYLVFRPVSATAQWFDPLKSTPYQDLFLSLDDGIQISARWFPCADSAKAILYCHPRNGNLSIALKSDKVEEWQRRANRSVLVFDYPGYGKSTGRPTEAGCYRAAQAAYLWLTVQQGVDSDDLLVVGRSMGTGVAVDLASRNPCEGLVLISPFTTLPDAGQYRCPVLPARWLMRNRFDNLSKIPDCQCPVLIVHGTHDDWVPVEQARRLLAAAHQPKWLSIVEGADHGDKVLASFFETLRAFLSETSKSGHVRSIQYQTLQQSQFATATVGP
jgi:pimeloyl-ACP methyl ester carboxylesterase